VEESFFFSLHLSFQNIAARDVSKSIEFKGNKIAP